MARFPFLGNCFLLLFIIMIRSDLGNATEQLLYNLNGPGSDEPPLHLFTVNQKTGFVRITGILDREVIANYTLYASARYARNMSLAEDSLILIIIVSDINDNAPEFPKSGLPPGSVYEKSPKGTLVTQVHATDADQVGTPHTDLRYTIIKQEPQSQMMFYIEPKTGKIKVKEPNLDRETQSSYVLTVKAKDMGDSTTGLSGTGKVNVTILDINDNRPVLHNSTFAGVIEENAFNKEVMRFKASDRDEVPTDNWLAKFEILSGNEDGYFSIETDPKTNEGVLMLSKPVDYEHVKELYLEVAVDNAAAYEFSHGIIEEPGEGRGEGGGRGEGEGRDKGEGRGEGEGAGEGRRAGGAIGGARGGGRKKYPVNIKVKNVLDGPRFVPELKPITISEDKEKTTVPMLLTNYQAIDEDSGEIAKNVRYAKSYDPAGWIAVDGETGDVKLTRVPDRESKHVVDGVYYAKILCISEDMPFKTATGTIAIQVEDVNEHCPELTTSYQNLCTDEKVVYVTAHDKDDHFNSPPFTFKLLSEGTIGSWDIIAHNDTTVSLTAQDFLQPGTYVVAFEINDNEGHACSEPEVLDLIACNCLDNRTCTTDDRATLLDVSRPLPAKLGGAAIGILVAALLLLLLTLLLLLACTYGGGQNAGKLANLPFQGEGQLIAYHTEGKGEDKDITSMTAMLSKAATMCGAPNVPARSLITAKNVNALSSAFIGSVNTASSAWTGNMNTSSSPWTGNMNTVSSTLHKANERVQSKAYTQEYKTKCSSETGVDEDDDEEDALPYAYLEDYFLQKASGAVDSHTVDSLRVYEDEGQGSAAGSVDGSLELEVDHSLDFLDGLDSNFATLAEICKRQETASEFATATDTATAAVAAANVFKTPPPPSPMEKVHVKKVHVKKVHVKKAHVTMSSAVAPKMVHKDVVVQNQAYVVPRPMYYAAAPVIQSQYVVRPQAQKTVLVPDSRQAVYVVSDTPVTEKMVGLERRVAAGPVAHGGMIAVPPGSLRGEGLMLVRNVGQSHKVHEVGSGHGLVQMGNLSGPKNIMLLENQVLNGGLLGLSELNGAESNAFVRRGEDMVKMGENEMLVEGQVGAGQVLQGGRSWIQQGPLQTGSVSGSQNILLVREREGTVGQVLGHPVSPQHILLESNWVTSKVCADTWPTRSVPGTMRLDADTSVKSDPVVENGVFGVQGVPSCTGGVAGHFIRAEGRECGYVGGEI